MNSIPDNYAIVRLDHDLKYSIIQVYTALNPVKYFRIFSEKNRYTIQKPNTNLLVPFYTVNLCGDCLEVMPLWTAIRLLEDQYNDDLWISIMNTGTE